MLSRNTRPRNLTAWCWWSFRGCDNVQTGEYFLTFQTSMWPSFAGLAVEYAIPWRWRQHASLKVSNSLPVSTAEHCRAEFSSGRILVSHSLFFMGLYFVFLQIHGIIQRIKVHHLDLSVVRSIRIVCQIVPPYFKELHCLCKGKKNTNEILEHYFLGWSVIHRFLLFASGLGTFMPWKERGDCI